MIKKIKRRDGPKKRAYVGANQSETLAPARNIKTSNVLVGPLDEDEINAQQKSYVT